MMNFKFKKSLSLALSVIICLSLMVTAMPTACAEETSTTPEVTELTGEFGSKLGSNTSIKTEYNDGTLRFYRNKGSIGYRLADSINLYELTPSTEYFIQFEYMSTEVNPYDEKSEMYIGFARTDSTQSTPTSTRSLTADTTLVDDVTENYDTDKNSTFIAITEANSNYKTAVLRFKTYETFEDVRSSKQYIEPLLTLVLLASSETDDTPKAEVFFRNFKIVKSPEAAVVGNVNGDDCVDIRDLLTFKKWLADSTSVVTFKAENAVIANDAIIDVDDQIKLRANLLNPLVEAQIEEQAEEQVEELAEEQTEQQTLPVEN